MLYLGYWDLNFYNVGWIFYGGPNSNFAMSKTRSILALSQDLHLQAANKNSVHRNLPSWGDLILGWFDLKSQEEEIPMKHLVLRFS